MNEKEIDELATHLAKEFSQQNDNDTIDKDIIRQKHVIDAQKDKKLQVRPVGTGYGKLVSAQNRSYLSAAPFIAYTAPRDTLKAFAEELEGATQEMWNLSGARLAWLRSIRDVVDVGRGWLLIHSLPKLWKDLNFQQGENEPDKAYLDRLTDLKLNNWPVIAQHIDVRDCWPTFTLKRELDQVVEIREMTVRQVEEAYGSRFGRDKDTDKVKVIVYADHHEMRTVIAKHGGVAGEGETPAVDALPPWEHGMKMNPYVLMEAPPLSENDEGVVWEGSVAALRHLIPEMDGALTDMRHNGRKQARAQRVFKLNLDDRRENAPTGASNADLITITPDGDIILNTDEFIELLGAAPGNPDIGGFLLAARSFTQEVAIRASLLGIGESESGVEFNTKSQIAQNDFGPTIDFLQEAAKNVARHFHAALISFSETFKDIGLKDDKIPLSFVNSKGISQRTDLSASDLKGWDKRLQAKMEAQIPINRNQQIVTARLAADPQSGIMSLETAMELYTPIANPQEERRQRDLDKMKTALVEAWVQAAQQQAALIASQPANTDILTQDFAALPESQQLAVQMSAQAQGQTVPEARAGANEVREGMVQVSGR